MRSPYRPEFMIAKVLDAPPRGPQAYTAQAEKAYRSTLESVSHGMSTRAVLAAVVIPGLPRGRCAQTQERGLTVEIAPV